MKPSNDNYSFINYIRGIAIILMLWGHCLQYCCGGQFDFFENICFKIIYSFHMPLFMLISGYLFYFSAQKRDLFGLIEHRIKSLLYPLLMCSALNLILTKGILIFRGQFSGILGASSLISFWFIWAVISNSIALGTSVKATDNPLLQMIFILAGIGFIGILPCWETNIYMYPYFIIGYMYSKYKNNLNNYFNLTGLISLVIFIIMIYHFEIKHYIYISGLFGVETLKESLNYF